MGEGEEGGVGRKGKGDIGEGEGGEGKAVIVKKIKNWDNLRASPSSKEGLMTNS